MSIHVLLLYLALYAGQGTGHDKARLSTLHSLNHNYGHDWYTRACTNVDNLCIWKSIIRTNIAIPGTHLKVMPCPICTKTKRLAWNQTSVENDPPLNMPCVLCQSSPMVIDSSHRDVGIGSCCQHLCQEIQHHIWHTLVDCRQPVHCIWIGQMREMELHVVHVSTVNARMTTAIPVSCIVLDRDNRCDDL